MPINGSNINTPLQAVFIQALSIPRYISAVSHMPSCHLEITFNLSS